MEEVRQAAVNSVARGCGFAALGIACIMIGFANDPVACLKAGGILILMLTLVLVIKAHMALSRDVKKTEIWLMLDPEHRPLDPRAREVAARILHDVYLRFARASAGLAVGTWALALLASLMT